MNIFDDLSIAFNKAQASIGRFADQTSLKFKVGEAERKRRDFMAQLGESLYDAVCADPDMRVGREEILVGIARCETERAQAQSELDRIAQEAAAAKRELFTCSRCGGTLILGANFCPTCGVAIKSQASPHEQPFFNSAAQQPEDEVNPQPTQPCSSTQEQQPQQSQ